MVLMGSCGIDFAYVGGFLWFDISRLIFVWCFCFVVALFWFGWLLSWLLVLRVCCRFDSLGVWVLYLWFDVCCFACCFGLLVVCLTLIVLMYLVFVGFIGFYLIIVFCFGCGWITVDLILTLVVGIWVIVLCRSLFCCFSLVCVICWFVRLCFDWF